MDYPDFINGLFELVGSVVVFVNIRRIKKDKKVRGVYWPVWAFYSVWGFWNLYYYPSLDQWYSLAAGILIVTGNTWWFLLALKYRKN